MWIELLEFEFDMGSPLYVRMYNIYIIAPRFSQMSLDLKSGGFALSHEPTSTLH